MSWLRRRNEEADKPVLAAVTAVADEEDAEDEQFPCVRCGTELTFFAERAFREGTGGFEFAFGRIGSLFANSTRMELWVCGSCGHVEFFFPGIGE